MPDQPAGIPPEAYDRDYFVRECQGHEAFHRSGGHELPTRLTEALRLAGPLDGQRILDLGCGRGELEVYGTAQGAHIVGLDFSWDALQLAAEIVPPTALGLVRASALRLPFADNSFDLALAFDLVEHLYPHELDAMLAEAYRVLRPGGRLIVHTMPNLWYYRYAYPFYRWVQRLRGVHLPHDPRDRSRHVHVNIQSITALADSLRRAGFGGRVRLHNTQDFATETNPAMRRVYRLLANAYPFKWIFCNDVFGLGVKG